MENLKSSTKGLRSFSLYNIAFTVTDLERSLKWYSDVLGFTEVSRSNFQLPTGTAEAAIIEAGRLKLELLYVPGGKRIDDLFAELPLHLIPIGNKAIVLQVDDIRIASNELAAKGVKFVYREINLVEGAMFSTMIEDIDGNKINIFQTDSLLENKIPGKEAAIAGIDHIGMNVPDIDAATTFLQQAFGAEVIYESYHKEQPALELTGIEDALNVSAGTKIYACRMVRMGYGPNIEMFEIHVDCQREAVKTSDLGLQHFCVYTDNIFASAGRFASAGGRMLSEPNAMLFSPESGDHNFFCYGLTPWGTTVEFITYPDRMPYEAATSLRRWKGGRSIH